MDVFGFQEVRLEVAENPAKQKLKNQKRQKKRKKKSTQFQVSQLARHLPDHQFVYQPAMLYAERLLEREEEGLAVFSRYPIVSTDYRLLYKYGEWMIQTEHLQSMCTLQRNDSDVEDNHQRICLHAELLIPQLGPVMPYLMT